ncbi:MAG TPA: DHH family phosphoesterase [Candidatus Cloacimonadota bacterium]|nr:DHH family phosphoesterase [Candidatus Cloacimonadota bacterium]
MIYKKVIDFINESRNKDICFLDGEIDLVNLEEISKHSEKAIERIVKAVKNDEKILIFGHDDADGITGTFILYDFLKQAYDKVDYYIPNREIEHHGIYSNVINYAAKNGVNLFIAIDNGLSSIEGVVKLNKMEIDTIIIDHHIIPDIVPKAYSIVNPKLFTKIEKNDLYFKDNISLEMLAGAGVAYFFVFLLSQELKQAYFKKDYLFWAAIGTIADRVPLVSINRLIIRQLIHDWDISLAHPAIQYLLEKSRYLIHRHEKYDFLLNTVKLFYYGRQENGEHLCFSFLNSNKREDLENVYNEIISLQNNYNEVLQTNESYINENVIKIIDEQMNYDRIQSIDDRLYLFYYAQKIISIVFYDDTNSLTYSILGTLANLLLNKYKCPIVMLIDKDENNLACEARSIGDFNWISCFKSMAELFENFGGHARAAGFLMKKTNFSAFIEQYHEYVEHNKQKDEYIAPNNFITFEYYDAVYEEIIELYNLFMPFGDANPNPVFKILNPSILDEHRQIFINYEKVIESFNSPQYDAIEAIYIKYSKDCTKLNVINYE